MCPAIDSDAGNVSCRIKPARTEQATKLVTHVTFEGLKRRFEQGPAALAELLGGRQSRCKRNVLQKQNAEKWSAEDKALDAKIAEFKKQNDAQ